MLRLALACMTLAALPALAPPTAPYVVALPGQPVYTARLTPAQASFVRRQHGALVERDRLLSVASTTQQNATWGLDRVDQRALPLNEHYRYATTASTVHAYVIDTGIDTADADFGGRAAIAYDATGGDGRDCNGHGTHVAGILGGRLYGVAKAVQLEAVRVLNCQGQGTTSTIIKGIEWVTRHAVEPAVVNLSLGGGYSAVLNQAVNDLADSGVFVAVAAGNSSTDACNDSPASASRVVTVAASDSTDTKASWSNDGSCVDLYAPGAAITSDWLGGATRVLSGTSMAAPFVAGAAALYESKHPTDSTATVNAWLEAHATASAIKKNPSGTPNRLLYTGSI